MLVVRTRPVSFAPALRRLSLLVVNWEGAPKEMEQGAYSKQGQCLTFKAAYDERIDAKIIEKPHFHSQMHWYLTGPSVVGHHK